MSYSLYLILVIAAAIGIVVGITLLFRLMKIPTKAGVITGLILGLIGAAALFVIPARVYVVSGTQEATVVDQYVCWGNYTMEYSDGTTQEVVLENMTNSIANNSEMMAVVSPVIYGTVYNEADEMEFYIYPMETQTLEGVYSIDYMPNEEPPESIDSNSSGEVKHQLWVASFEDDDYYEDTEGYEDKDDSTMDGE